MSTEFITLSEKQNTTNTLLGFLRKNNAYPPTKQKSTHQLLKTAYVMLENAERDLASKDERIAHLEKILTQDELTSITNRRGFYKAFEAELERTNRGHTEGGVIVMIDLDDFKSINDTHGHGAGDQALKIVAEYLHKTVRSMDVAARIGGDEFIVLLSNTTISKSMKRAQKLGKDLNNITFKSDGHKIKIKASLGLQEYKKGDTIDSIIKAADQGMYDNKESKKTNKAH